MLNKIIMFLVDIFKYGLFAGLEFIFFRIRGALSNRLDSVPRPSLRSNPTKKTTNRRYHYPTTPSYSNDGYYQGFEEAF